MTIRLVVTGQTPEGKSVIVSDEQVEPIPGTGISRLWALDAPPSFPQNGSRPAFTSLFPPLGGARFYIMTVMPDEGGAEPSPQLNAEDGRFMDSVRPYMETDVPGMHTTDTVDFEVLLSGEASQEFDDGRVVHLKAGDCFVQNGTRHRWFNRGTEPAVLAVVMVGGEARSR